MPYAYEYKLQLSNRVLRDVITRPILFKVTFTNNSSTGLRHNISWANTHSILNWYLVLRQFKPGFSI